MRERLGETLFGVLLLGLGLISIYKAAALPFGSLGSPDSGLYPVYVGVALTLFAALSLVARSPVTAEPVERAGVVRVFVLIAAVAIYAWLLPRAGFIVGNLFQARVLGVDPRRDDRRL